MQECEKIKNHKTADSMEERIMDKVTIVFWSQSGNTESMANAVAEGVTAAGKEAVVVDVASASLDDLKAAKGFAMGCPGSRSARRRRDGTICMRCGRICSR